MPLPDDSDDAIDLGVAALGDERADDAAADRCVDRSVVAVMKVACRSHSSRPVSTAVGGVAERPSTRR